jgi:hypothetical protein
LRGGERDLQADGSLSALQLADDSTIHPNRVSDAILGESERPALHTERHAESGCTINYHGIDR